MITDDDGVIQYNRFVRAPYNYDADSVSRETGLKCEDGTRTQQQFKDECNINIILERFGVTGSLPITTMQPLSGDFVNIEGDYHTAVEQIRAAEQNFMRLPSKIRERFNNEPGKFVDFCVDPANIEAVRDLGLAPRPAAPALKEIIDGNAGKANGT